MSTVSLGKRRGGISRRRNKIRLSSLLRIFIRATPTDTRNGSGHKPVCCLPETLLGRRRDPDRLTLCLGGTGLC